MKLLTRGDLFFPIAVDPKDIPTTDLDDAIQKFQEMVDEGQKLKTYAEGGTPDGEPAIGAAGGPVSRGAARKGYDQWKAMRKMELRDDVYKLLLDELNEAFDFIDLKDAMDKRCNVDFDKYKKQYINDADENLDFLEPKIWQDWKREMFVSQIKKAGHLGRLNNKVYTQITEKYVVIPAFRNGDNLADYWPAQEIVLVDPPATMPGAYQKPGPAGGNLDLVYVGAAGAIEAHFTLAGYPGAQIAGLATSLKIRTRTVKKRGRMTTERFKRDITFNEIDANGFCPVNGISLNVQQGNDFVYQDIFNEANALPQDSVAKKIRALIKNLDKSYNKCFKAELKKLHSQEPYLYPLKLTGGVPHRMYQGPVGELGASDPFDVNTLIDGRRRRRRTSSFKRKKMSRGSKRRSRGSKNKDAGSNRRSSGSKKTSRGSKRRSRGSRKRRGISRRH
jgi:hypothetical protein